MCLANFLNWWAGKSERNLTISRRHRRTCCNCCCLCAENVKIKMEALGNHKMDEWKRNRKGKTKKDYRQKRKLLAGVAQWLLNLIVDSKMIQHHYCWLTTNIQLTKKHKIKKSFITKMLTFSRGIWFRARRRFFIFIFLFKTCIRKFHFCHMKFFLKISWIIMLKILKYPPSIVVFFLLTVSLAKRIAHKG